MVTKGITVFAQITGEKMVQATSATAFDGVKQAISFQNQNQLQLAQVVEVDRKVSQEERIRLGGNPLVAAMTGSTNQSTTWGLTSSPTQRGPFPKVSTNGLPKLWSPCYPVYVSLVKQCAATKCWYTGSASISNPKAPSGSGTVDDIWGIWVPKAGGRNIWWRATKGHPNPGRTSSKTITRTGLIRDDCDSQVQNSGRRFTEGREERYKEKWKEGSKGTQ